MGKSLARRHLGTGHLESQGERFSRQGKDWQPDEDRGYLGTQIGPLEEGDADP